MSDSPRPAHRPGRYADLTAYLDAAHVASHNADTPDRRAEVAATTAALVVGAGRDPDGDRRADLVELADTLGLETLAELWRGAEPISLAGVLWTLYLLRQWCTRHAAVVARLWRAGEIVDPVDAVIAGISDQDGPAAVATLADDVLTGVYRGDLAVTLERAAAVFRVVAAGRRELAAGPDRGDQVTLADANDRAAGNLVHCAALWRAGVLR